jgi:HK97 family phage portal protein
MSWAASQMTADTAHRGWPWQRWLQHNIDKMKLWGTGADIGEPVHAGVPVSQENALQLSVVWACIRLLTGTLAGLPAEAVRKRGEIREPVARSPRWLEQPNPESSWYELAERIFESRFMDGNAFVLITARDALGFPAEIWTLNPRTVVVKRRLDPPHEIYFVWGGSRELTRFSPANPFGDVLHIKGPTAGGIRGLSPIEAAKQAIGLGLVSEKFGARFFGKGQQASGVIQLPADQPARSKEHIELMKATWEEAHAGSERAFRPAVLTGGATWTTISVTPEEAQFLETRKFQVEEIASRIYGVPPHMIGMTEKQTSWGTGIEQQSIGFVRFTLLPEIIRFETAMSQLMPRGQFLRLNQRGLVRADSETESKVLVQQLLNGIRNRNEVRALFDEPPVPGGDRYMIPLNEQVLPANGLAEPPAEEAPSPSGNGRAPANVGGNGGQAP